MPDPSTSRINLYKSKSDGSEDVDYTQDLGQNWDRVDAAVGAFACTSTTRPSVPWNGQLIRETNTGRLWVSNGSAPASGSWTEIATPGTLQNFTGGTANIGATSTTTVGAAYVTGDGNNRYALRADGRQSWGPGNAATDTVLYRSGVGALTTDGKLTVGGDLVVNGVGQGLFVRKSADTGRASATMSNDPHLTLSVVAGAVYELDCTLFTISTDVTNADLNLIFSAPASTGGLWSSFGPQQGATTSSTDVASHRLIGTPFDNSTSRIFGCLTTGAIPILIGGIVRPTASGTFAANWARQGSSGTTTLLTDSYLKLTRVA